MGNFIKVNFKRNQNSKNMYVAVIPSEKIQGSNNLYYYLKAIDEADNKRVLKDDMDDPFYVEIVSEDTVPPNIGFDPPNERPKTNAVMFTANVIDNIRVKDVSLKYKFDLELNKYQTQQMELFAKNVYGAQIFWLVILIPLIQRLPLILDTMVFINYHQD